MENQSNYSVNRAGQVVERDYVHDAQQETIAELTHSESRGNKQLRIERRLNKSLKQELKIVKAQLELVVEHRDRLIADQQIYRVHVALKLI